MEAPKVTLSEAECLLLADPAVILTKNSVISKISEFFGELGNHFYQLSAELRKTNPEIFEPHPRVSKGEKHRELPWVMLDYPRFFDREGHVAIRCFCWWGHYYSIQLQVSGKFLRSFVNAFRLVPETQSSKWYVGLADDPWDLQLPPAAWEEITDRSSANASGFFKMAKKIPISEWEQLEIILTNHFEELKKLVETALKLQYGEIVL
jgi:hypothetical protein